MGKQIGVIIFRIGDLLVEHVLRDKFINGFGFQETRKFINRRSVECFLAKIGWIDR